MPRYFFDVQLPDGRLFSDNIGVDLTNDAAALREAEEAASSFAGDRRLGGFDYSGWSFQLRKETGATFAASAFLVGLCSNSGMGKRAGSGEPRH